MVRVRMNQESAETCALRAQLASVTPSAYFASASKPLTLLKEEGVSSGKRQYSEGMSYLERRRYFLSLKFCAGEFHHSNAASGVASGGRPSTVPPPTRASPKTRSKLRSSCFIVCFIVCLRFASARTKPKTRSRVSGVTFALTTSSSGQVRAESVKHRVASSIMHI